MRCRFWLFSALIMLLSGCSSHSDDENTVTENTIPTLRDIQQLVRCSEIKTLPVDEYQQCIKVLVNIQHDVRKSDDVCYRVIENKRRCIPYHRLLMATINAEQTVSAFSANEWAMLEGHSKLSFSY